MCFSFSSFDDHHCHHRIRLYLTKARDGGRVDDKEVLFREQRQTRAMRYREHLPLPISVLDWRSLTAFLLRAKMSKSLSSSGA